MENVILIGASGFVGSAILNEALNRGHRVTAVVPHPEKISTIHPNLTVVQADATDPDTLAKLAEGKDAVISAYNPGWGNPRQYEETLENYPKIVEGAKRSGVRRSRNALRKTGCAVGRYRNASRSVVAGCEVFRRVLSRYADKRKRDRLGVLFPCRKSRQHGAGCAYRKISCRQGRSARQ